MALVATIADAPGAVRADEALRRISVAEYHGLIASGNLSKQAGDFELLDGYLIQKMSKKPAHNYCQIRLMKWLAQNTPDGYIAGQEVSITLDESEPEPDGVLVVDRGDEYFSRNATGAETALVVEIGDSSLDRDRVWKLGIYARAKIPNFWIVNIPERCVEMYSEPVGEVYASRLILRGEERAYITVGGKELGAGASDFFSKQ
jgi:Uma2 family endonuclease